VQEKHAAEHTARLNPDVVLLHVSEVRPSFAELISAVRDTCSRAEVVVLCREVQHPCLGRALAAGARGFVLLRGEPKYLFNAIRAAARARRFVDPNLSEEILNALEAQNSAERKPLSRRELQVLRMFAQGYMLKEIASRLGLSPKSIETYQARLREKLSLRTRADLVRYALEAGILNESPTAGREG